MYTLHFHVYASCKQAPHTHIHTHTHTQTHTHTHLQPTPPEPPEPPLLFIPQFRHCTPRLPPISLRNQPSLHA